MSATDVTSSSSSGISMLRKEKSSKLGLENLSMMKSTKSIKVIPVGTSEELDDGAGIAPSSGSASDGSFINNREMTRRRSLNKVDNFSQSVTKGVIGQAGVNLDSALQPRKASAISKSLNTLLSNNIVRAIMLLNTLVALFIYDLNAAYFSKNADFAVMVVLCISFVVFTTEMSISLVAKSNYFCSFYFFLDLVGTISLIPDILQLYGNLDKTNNAYDVARAGRAGRVARSAGSLRFARFARIFRIVRLVRIARLFGFIQNTRQAMSADKEGEGPSGSKLGILLSDTISKRIIMMVIVLIIAVPYFEGDTGSTTDSTTPMSATLSIIEGLSSQTDAYNSSQILLSYSADMIYLSINSIVMYQDVDTINSLRYFEILTTITANSTAFVNIKDGIQLQSQLHMVLVLFIIVVFAVGSYIVSEDANRLVVKPIERMTNVIRKLAGTIAILSIDDTFGHGEGDDEANAMNETDMLERAVKKIAMLFDVSQDHPHDKHGRKKSKAERMMTGSKTTEIVAKGAIYRINVVEAPHMVNTAPMGSGRRASKDLSDVKGSPIKLERGEGTSSMLAGSSSTLSHNGIESAEIKREYPELGSLNAILNNSTASQYFKVFLVEKLQIENYLFWQECEKFKTQFLLMADRILSCYIAQGTVNQVNIPHSMSDSIVNAVKKEDISIHMFDKAQAEIFKLMNQNNYERFILSSTCADYIDDKESKLKQAHLSLMEEEPSSRS